MTKPNSTTASLAERFGEQQARLAGMTFPNALTVGDRAPQFALPNASGRLVDLAELLAAGPVVLTFYRGAWCPYCNMQLRGLQQALPEIESLGAVLVAVSPQVPDGSLELIDEHELTFEVLSDARSRIASDYGIVFALAAADRALLLEAGNDLATTNDDELWVLPAPATFVIAGSGTIRYVRVDPDYTNRVEPAELIGALRAIAARDRD
jgi:peroxiredoxin